MDVSLIVAHDLNGLIGVDGKLPWHIPDDLKHFKARTAGVAVIMGRKTYESLPVRPLPGRTNVVLSRHAEDGLYIGRDGHYNCDSMVSALATLEHILGVKDAFIIGGTEVFSEGMKYANTIYRTVVETAIRTEDKPCSYFREFDRIVRPEWDCYGVSWNIHQGVVIRYETFKRFKRAQYAAII